MAARHRATRLLPVCDAERQVFEDAAVALRVRAGTPKPCGWPQALGWRKKHVTMSNWEKRLLSAE